MVIELDPGVSAARFIEAVRCVAVACDHDEYVECTATDDTKGIEAAVDLVTAIARSELDFIDPMRDGADFDRFSEDEQQGDSHHQLRTRNRRWDELLTLYAGSTEEGLGWLQASLDRSLALDKQAEGRLRAWHAFFRSAAVAAGYTKFRVHGEGDRWT